MPFYRYPGFKLIRAAVGIDNHGGMLDSFLVGHLCLDSGTGFLFGKVAFFFKSLEYRSIGSHGNPYFISLKGTTGFEHNRRFHDAAPAIYQCPSAELAPGQTTYSVVVGEKTAFQAAEGKSLDDFGMNLILVVEREQSTNWGGRGQSVCWMNPMSELDESISSEGINRREKDTGGIGSPHPAGVNVGLRDGSVQFISETIDLSLLRGLLDGSTEECQY